MKTAYIVCGLLKPDVEKIIEEESPAGDIIWMEAGLHVRPEVLREALQETLDGLEGYDEAALAYALCGNALLGLRASTCKLRYLCTDDCISAVMCDNPNLPELRRHCMFTNRSWLNNPVAETEDIAKTIAKYGEKRAKRILEVMYGNYTNTCYMQTEETVAEEDLRKAEEMAGLIGTELIFEPASNEVYRCLFAGEPHRLIKSIEKGGELRFEDFYGPPKAGTV